jgi:plasmid stabilization system protein ParE
MKPVEVHPEAKAEATGAFNHYWERSPSAALEFEAELRAAYGSLRKSPLIHSPYLYGTRRVLLHRYPLSVIFRERLNDIQIIAIAHSKRRPGDWAKRLSLIRLETAACEDR